MRRWFWLLPLALLQACAGTPLADQLERSFDTPDAPAQPPRQPLSPTPPSKAVPDAEAIPETRAVQTLAPASQPAESAPAPRMRRPPSQPRAPYRITIRLAGADPSAPAEAVTQALRSSAVDFMVERVERVQP